jgi:hypothetical protein
VYIHCSWLYRGRNRYLGCTVRNSSFTQNIVSWKDKKGTVVHMQFDSYILYYCKITVEWRQIALLQPPNTELWTKEQPLPRLMFWGVFEFTVYQSPRKRSIMDLLRPFHNNVHYRFNHFKFNHTKRQRMFCRKSTPNIDLYLVTRTAAVILLTWQNIPKTPESLPMCAVTSGIACTVTVMSVCGLSITEETWLIEMRIWCIKIGIVLVLYCNKSDGCSQETNMYDNYNSTCDKGREPPRHFGDMPNCQKPNRYCLLLSHKNTDDNSIKKT